MKYLDFLLNIDLEEYLDSFEYKYKRDKERYKYLVKCLDKSIVQLYKKDKFLLEKGVHEQSISHKLAHYMQNNIEEEKTGLFEIFSVDCEYNKNLESEEIRKMIFEPINEVFSKLFYICDKFEPHKEIEKKVEEIIKRKNFFCDVNIEELKKILTEKFEDKKKEIEEYLDKIRKYIRPDIIVHERGKNRNNLLVIEIKKIKFKKDLVKEEESDIDKLKRITLQRKNENENETLRYKFGIFINFGNNNKISGNNSNIKEEVSFRIVLIINGKEVTHWICKKTKECIKN